MKHYRPFRFKSDTGEAGEEARTDRSGGIVSDAIPLFKYCAFLSYSHRDAAWAKWLHRALESYRIDKDLVGRETPRGPVPKTLRPIFRDREDFSAGHSLNEQTIAALEASQFLIIICSPNAARSQYVNDEIRHFKAGGGAAGVIPIIVEGEPGDPERECFPPAIRFKLGANGALTDQREEPIAADTRPQGDGKEIAKQKVVAALLGVGLDEIMRRAERARKRRNRLRIGLTSGACVILAATVAGWVWAASFGSELNSSQVLAVNADAAYVCQRAIDQSAAYSALEPRRTAIAVKCLDVLGDALDVARSERVPLGLVAFLEQDVELLEQLKAAGKLTAPQVESLKKGEALVAQLQRRH